ncbi:MAG: hypothetical protein ACJ74G_06930 [Blastocatellia bacterium]
MWKRILSMALVCALYFCFVCVKPGLAQSPAERPFAVPVETRDQAQAGQTDNQPAPPQTAKEAQQAGRIKRDVENHGVASKITVILKDNQERYGEIARIDDDTFQVVEVDMKQLLTFAYKDVKKVRFNYGNPNPFNGKRWHPRWGHIAGIAVIAFILIVIPLSIPRT